MLEFLWFISKWTGSHWLDQRSFVMHPQPILCPLDPVRVCCILLGLQFVPLLLWHACSLLVSGVAMCHWMSRWLFGIVCEQQHCSFTSWLSREGMVCGLLPLRLGTASHQGLIDPKESLFCIVGLGEMLYSSGHLEYQGQVKGH